MNIRSIKLTLAAMCYMYASVMVWLLGWVRPIVSIPLIILLCVGIKDFLEERMRSGESTLFVSKSCLLFCAAVVFLWVVLCGSGAVYAQTGDWDKHNCIFNDLVTRSWPVYYHNDQEDAMLTYYIGQYLIPATIGKAVRSYRIGEIITLLWNFLGTYMAALFVMRVTNANTARKQIFTVIGLVFFSNVLFLGRGLYAATAIGSGDVAGTEWISNSILLQYRSMTVALRWTPNNSIVPWIATALFAEEKGSFRHYIIIAASLLLNATFSFLGLALLMIGVFTVKMALPSTTNEERIYKLKECFSIPNLCAAASLPIMLAYLSGGFLGEGKPEALGFSLIDYGANTTLYFCFCMTFLCYSLIIFQVFEKNIWFYVVNVLLLVLPFFRMGLWNDLCMAGSVPAIFLLMAFTFQALFQYTNPRTLQRSRATGLVLLLALGAIYPARDLINASRTGPVWDGSARCWQAETMENYAYRDGRVIADLAYNYLTYDYESSLFYRYLARGDDIAY